MIKAMGLFLLMLLKIAGWLLLILLIILLAALLLILFVPVHYDVLAKNERGMEPGQKNPAADLRLQLKVSWLLHLVYVSMQYGPDGLTNHIRVAGIDIPKFLAKRAEKKENRKKENHKSKNYKNENHKNRNAKKNKKSSKQESVTDEFLLQESLTEESITQESVTEESITQDSFVPTQENICQNDSTSEEIKKQKFENDKSQINQPGQDHLEQNNRKQNKSKQRNDGNRNDGNRKHGVLKHGNRKHENPKHENPKHGNPKHEKIKQSKEKEKQNQKSKQNVLSKIRSQFRRFHQEFTDEVNRHALSRLWTELLKLLKSYKPRKLKADISFSLADPALTGMATGVISLMPVIYRYPCSIAPDFTSEKWYVEGEILARGRVTVFVFLLSLLRLLRDKKFMYVVRRLLKRGGA